MGSSTDRKDKFQSPPRPDWIKVKGIRIDVQQQMAEKLRGNNTVCLSAKCPNMGECFARGVATFMIGGNICTRACRFCGIRHGRPLPIDPEEPAKVAESVNSLGLKFIVITGVARDDLSDGGASHYAATVRAVKENCPGTGVEVLIPDFRGSADDLKIVLDSKPDVLNHNIETVRRLTPRVRSKFTYERSLELLERAFNLSPEIPTKSGLMVGHGETFEEVIESLEDLIKVECMLLTIGQYLQPRARQELPVVRYWTPDEFDEIKKVAIDIGFRGVASGPFVRSSYFAEELAKSHN